VIRDIPIVAKNLAKTGVFIVILVRDVWLDTLRGRYGNP
jgi:hypothetical protein